MYAVWDRYKDDPAPDSAKTSFTPNPATSPFGGGSVTAGSKHSASASASGPGSIKSPSISGTPAEAVEDSDGWDTYGTNGFTANVVTPAMLVALLTRMREAKWADMAHSASGRHVAVNKMLERTQAAG